ncbi:MAG TPA: hypothetical protein VKA32_10695 [Gammaproteobacteria bacterium]|nr:hypothetical protein [Gammaproteobacteria bacterium]
MTRTLALSLALATVLSGCGIMNQHYAGGESSNDIPEGPGMLSGQDGAFVIYSDEKDGQQTPSEAGERTNDTADDHSERSKDAASGDASPAPADTAEYREFRDYQAFLRWKRTAKGTEAYREFQDWRKWRNYKRWQEQHPQ